MRFSECSEKRRQFLSCVSLRGTVFVQLNAIKPAGATIITQAAMMHWTA